MKVLWAVKKGAPDWQEDIITQHADVYLEEAKRWAIDQGYDRFRLAIYDDIPEKPDFTKTINL